MRVRALPTAVACLLTTSCFPFDLQSTAGFACESDADCQGQPCVDGVCGGPADDAATDASDGTETSDETWNEGIVEDFADLDDIDLAVSLGFHDPHADTYSPGDVGSGRDGDIELTAGSDGQLALEPIARSMGEGADGIAYRVDLSAPIQGSDEVVLVDVPNFLAPGDEVLLINLQGEPGDIDDVGNFEFLDIESLDPTSRRITFTTPVARSYYGSSGATQRVALQRVPHYHDVTLGPGSALTTAPWDALAAEPVGDGGRRTGIVAFRVSGVLENNGGVAGGNAIGYRGGVAATESTGENFGGGNGGEGRAGPGGRGASSVVSPSVGGGAGGSGDADNGQGGCSTDGGRGGSVLNGMCDETMVGGPGGGGALRCGGGGAGHSTNGNAGLPGLDFAEDCPGGPGGPYGSAELERLYHGAGGGAGGGEGLAPGSGRGGTGGPIVVIAAREVHLVGQAFIYSLGDPGFDAAGGMNAGGGGGGAGGSLWLSVETLTTESQSAIVFWGGSGGAATGMGGAGGESQPGHMRFEWSTIDGAMYPSIDGANAPPAPAEYSAREFATNLIAESRGAATAGTPSEARVTISLIERDDAPLVPDDDILAWASSDDGVTWDAIALEEAGSGVFQGTTPLTGGGDELRYRVETRNDRRVRLTAVSLDWR